MLQDSEVAFARKFQGRREIWPLALQWRDRSVGQGTKGAELDRQQLL